MKRRDFIKSAALLPLFGCEKSASEEMTVPVRSALAIAEALFPPGKPFNVDVKNTDFARRMKKTLKILPPKESFLMKAGLTLIEYMPKYFSFHFKRLSSLSIEERKNYLRGWEESVLTFKRIAFKGIKQIICLVYGSLPEVKKEIGFAYPCGSNGRTLWEEQDDLRDSL